MKFTQAAESASRGLVVAVLALIGSPAHSLPALAAALPASGPAGPIATWSVQTNTSDWNKNLGVTTSRQGCSESPAACISFVRKVAQAANVHVQLAVPLDATTTANNAFLYSQLSLGAAFLAEVGVDDFVDQYRALSSRTPQPADVVNQVIANLKSANSGLKFGATIYDDQLTSPELQDARLPSATRARFDTVHLFIHFRADGPNFAASVLEAKQLFPNAAIIAGAYAYDRRAYLACSPGGQPCTTQQDLDLFTQTTTLQAQLLASQQIDSIEFYPGYFGTEDQWSGWSNPRECAPGDLANCLTNTRALRQVALNALTSGSPPTVGGSRLVINTVAGNGGGNYSGDNGPATSAQIAGPSGVAVDHFGNLYIVDAGNYVVRRVDARGVIRTFAGNSTSDNKCGSGAATSVGLDGPQGVAVDSANNVYIADQLCGMVFKVDPEGKNLAAFAGSVSPGRTGDGGPANDTQLVSPVGVAVDESGVVYIADSGSNSIRTVDRGGLIHTLAGNGAADYTGDGGPARSAALSTPQSVAVDRSGNVYIADFGNNVVRQVDTSGVIHTFAGSSSAGYAGDEGPAEAAQLLAPMGVSIDSSGAVYIADTGNNVVREVDSARVIRTIAGDGNGNFAGDGGAASTSELALPMSLVATPSGASGGALGSVQLYVADSTNNRVRGLSTPAPPVTVP